MSDPWRTAYQLGLVATTAEFALLLLLFLLLRPRTRMERATTAATAGLLGIFGVLTFWLLSDQPATTTARIYPPLVLAFWLSVPALGWFTAAAWRDWICRRRHISCDD